MNVTPFTGKRRRLDPDTARAAWLEMVARFHALGRTTSAGNLVLVAYWDFVNACYPNDANAASDLFSEYARRFLDKGSTAA